MTIKRVIEGKEYEIELTPAEIAAVCEYSEHEAAESLITDALIDRLDDMDDDEDTETAQQIRLVLADKESIMAMAEDFLNMKSYGNYTEEDALNEVIEKYTEV